MRQEQTYADISAPRDSMASAPRGECARDLSALPHQPGDPLPMAGWLPSGATRALTAAVTPPRDAAPARVDGGAPAGRGPRRPPASGLGPGPRVAGAQSRRPAGALRGDGTGSV